MAGLPAVLVLGPPRYVGPLGMMRSLGRIGVKVYGLRHRSAASSSRFCAGTVDVGRGGRPWGDDARTVAELTEAGAKIGEGAILVPGSDEWSVVVARNAAELARTYRFPTIPVELIQDLAAKDGLYRLALSHGLPTPRIAFPLTRDQALAAVSSLEYPVMLKPIQSRPDVLDKAVVDNEDDLMRAYLRMEESPDRPNVMFQEYIPGGDQDVWIFNGYFDQDSRCLAAFTGVKVRQHPARMGIASLGELRQNSTVIDMTTHFMQAVGYRGIVDIGYRFDRRDGQYKVLDINPRLGGAFRMFVGDDGLDVARAMYFDLTGKAVPPVRATDGRRWINEQADLVASNHYRKLEGLSLGGWLRSLRGVREGATWAPDDPIPFAFAMWSLAAETLSGKWRRFRHGARSSLSRSATRRSRAGETAA